MEYAVQPIRMKKPEFLAVSLRVTCKHNSESKLSFSVRRTLEKFGTMYPNGLSPTGYAITDSLFAVNSQKHSFTVTTYTFVSFHIH